MALAAALTATSAAAQVPPRSEGIDAFDQAYAASFYTFDACGDGVAGRLYRNALQARFAQCPFSDAARTRFRQRAVLQRRKSSAMMEKLIEDNDGVPFKLEGMSMTCREQRSTPVYTALRAQLEQYAAGAAPAQSVIPDSCTATAFTPYR